MHADQGAIPWPFSNQTSICVIRMMRAGLERIGTVVHDIYLAPAAVFPTAKGEPSSA